MGTSHNRPPFVILGTPRSRTAWFARFLSFRGWACLHEPTLHFRTIYDLRRYLSRKRIGAADSMMTLLWRDVLEYSPDANIVVVRRPLDHVRASFRRIGITLNPVQIALLAEIDAEAAALSARPGVMTVPFSDLERDSVIQAIVERTIGGTMQRERIAAYQRKNIQADYAAVERMVQANREGIGRVFGHRFVGIGQEAA